MKQLIRRHGRTHRPGGSDPIPGLDEMIHWGSNTDDSSLGLSLNSSEQLQMQFVSVNIDGSNGGGDTAIVGTNTNVSAADGELDLRASGVGGIVFVNSDDDLVRIQAATTVEINGDSNPGTSEVVRVNLGGKTFEFRSDGTIHGPTGGSVIWDL